MLQTIGADIDGDSDTDLVVSLSVPVPSAGSVFVLYNPGNGLASDDMLLNGWWESYVSLGLLEDGTQTLAANAMKAL